MAKPIKGGYKNVSLNNVDLATNDLVVDGLYNKLNDSYGKPIQLCGVVIDNVKKKNAFVQVSKDVNSGDIIVENIYGLKLTITNQDAISVGQAISSELPSVADASEGDALLLDAQKKPVWGAVSGGTKLYLHKVIFSSGDCRVAFWSPRATAYTSIQQLISDYKAHKLCGVGIVAFTGSYGNNTVPLAGIDMGEFAGEPRVYIYKFSSGTTEVTTSVTTYTTFVSDEVSEL